MPRPNPNRAIAQEAALARRIAYERERAGMTYDGLALRMTKAGCPIQGSAIYKIEKAGRRITVDELVALALVFETTVPELLRPVEHVLHREIEKVQKQLSQAWDHLFDAVDTVVSAMLTSVELYERAARDSDSDLQRAVIAYWDERAARVKDAADSGVFTRTLARLEQQEASKSDEERHRDEILRQVDDGVDALMDRIYEVTDPKKVLG